MLRFTSFVALMACSAAARQPVEPIANQRAITRYELPATHVAGGEGHHSARHTSSTVAGSLALVGAGEATTARLVLDIVTTTSYVRCSSGTWDGASRQACVRSVPPGAEDPRARTIVLAGRAHWQADQLRIELSKQLQPDPARPPFTARLVLACTNQPTGGLGCQVEDTAHLGIEELRHLELALGGPSGRAPRVAQP